MRADERARGHASSFHSYSAEAALAGIAEAGYRYVELSAVPGWTEHVNVHGDPAVTRAQLERYGLQAVSISGHSDLTTEAGLEHGLAVVRWAERFAVPIVNTAIGGHDWDFPAIGEGHVDFGRVLEILRDAGYQGPYAVEIEFTGEPWPPLAEVVEAMRTSRESLERLGL